MPLDRLLPKLIESCLRAYGASGFDFAVMTSDGTQNAETLKALGFAGQLPLRLLQTPIRRDLLAQAVFDSLTVHKLVEMRHIYQPGCICLPEQAMNEIMTQLYRRGLTVVSNRRGYGYTIPRAIRCNFWNCRPITTTAPTCCCRLRGKKPVRRMPVSCLRRTRPCIWGPDAAAATA